MMGSAATSRAGQDRSTSATCRPVSEKPPKRLPLLTWEQDRKAALLEARRAELHRRIGNLKPRSYARIVAEAELKALTLEALRPTGKSEGEA